MSPPLLFYASPPTNYIGTALFLSYIALALYATLSITSSLYTQYTRIFHAPPQTKNESIQQARSARARHIKIYAFLASVSFAALSYNMLSFLIANYVGWSGESVGGVTGGKLGEWMLDSTLFRDFARELVRDGGSAVGMQGAVLGTWFWNVWVGEKVVQRNFDDSTMRTYILLSQILPISFVSTLFIIRLHLSAPDLQTPPPNTSTAAKPSSNQTTPNGSSSKDTSTRSPIASLHIPNILLNATLLSLPSLSSHPTFIPLVLASRLILLLPHTGFIKLRPADVTKCMYISSGFVVANCMRGRKDAVVGGLMGGGYAVRALGWDAVLGGIVAGVLGWGGGV